MNAPGSAQGDGPSEADRRLIEDVAKQGRTITTGQIGRFRDKHLIPSPISARGLHGRGNWSVSYPEGTAERVVDILDMIDLPGKRMTLDEIPIWLFAFNRTVSLEEVRRSWTISHAKVLKKHPDSEEEIDQLHKNVLTNATRNITGRFLKLQIGKQVIRANNLAGEIYSSLVSRMVGEIPNDDVDETFSELVWLDDAEAKALFRGLLAQGVMRNIAGQVAALSDERLIRARDHLVLGLEVLTLCFPGATYSTHEETLKKYRTLLRADGWLIMINLMLLAYVDQTLDYFSSRLVEVVHEFRANPPNEAGQQV